MPSILTTGMTSVVAAVRNASRAASASATVKRALLDRVALPLGQVEDHAAGDAAKDAAVGRPRHQDALGGDDPGIGRGALGDEAVAVDEPRLERPGLPRLLLGEHVRQQRHRLDVDALPAVVGDGDDRDALRRPRLARRPGSMRRAVTTSVGGTAGSGKAWLRGATPRVTCR